MRPDPLFFFQVLLSNWSDSLATTLVHPYILTNSVTNMPWPGHCPEDPSWSIFVIQSISQFYFYWLKKANSSSFNTPSPRNLGFSIFLFIPLGRFCSKFIPFLSSKVADNQGTLETLFCNLVTFGSSFRNWSVAYFLFGRFSLLSRPAFFFGVVLWLVLLPPPSSSWRARHPSSSGTAQVSRSPFTTLAAQLFIF